MKEKIQTRDAGEVEIDSRQKINFPKGLFGFDDYHNYALLDWREDSPFQMLQSLENKEVAFIVLASDILFTGYKPEFEQEDIKDIEADAVEDLLFFVILTIPGGEPEKMTVNLQGPIVINKNNNKAVQVISMNDAHGVRVPLLELITEGGK